MTERHPGNAQKRGCLCGAGLEDRRPVLSPLKSPSGSKVIEKRTRSSALPAGRQGCHQDAAPGTDPEAKRGKCGRNLQGGQDRRVTRVGITSTVLLYGVSP